MLTLPEIASLIISLAIIAFLIYTIYILATALITGAPYTPSADHRIETMVKLAKIKKGDRAADLGSGDGRVVIALAKAGAEATGFEINPILVWLSRYHLQKFGLQKADAQIHMGNFWRYNLTDYNLITIYGMPHIMKRLEGKLQRELRPGARVVSNFFRFPTWPKAAQKNNVYLYKR